jgi:hypothetical protein
MEAEARAAASAQSSRLSVMLLALQLRDFRLLWLNSFGFFIGRGMQMVSVSWLVLELTDSPSLVGAVLFVQGRRWRCSRCSRALGPTGSTGGCCLS